MNTLAQKVKKVSTNKTRKRKKKTKRNVIKKKMNSFIRIKCLRQKKKMSPLAAQLCCFLAKRVNIVTRWLKILRTPGQGAFLFFSILIDLENPLKEKRSTIKICISKQKRKIPYLSLILCFKKAVEGKKGEMLQNVFPEKKKHSQSKENISFLRLFDMQNRSGKAQKGKKTAYNK